MLSSYILFYTVHASIVFDARYDSDHYTSITLQARICFRRYVSSHQRKTEDQLEHHEDPQGVS